MPTQPKDFTLPFVKKEQVAHDTWTFYFDRTTVPDLDFLPGQYIRMTLDLPVPDARGSGRFFSIASSPLNKEYLVITTRVLESTFKKTLASLIAGTEVRFFGPVGRFLLDEEDKRPRVFLAGGIGITPFHSMIIYALEKNLSFPITLFVSFSTAEGVIFYDELMKVSVEHKNIKIIYTVTKPEESKLPWSGVAGRISADLIKKYVPNFISSLFYVSGPPLMVDAMLEIVKEIGVLEEQVKKEKFTGY